MRSFTRMQNALYRFVRFINGILFGGLMPVTIHGDRNLLTSGPCIVYSNHIARLDPFLNHYIVFPRRTFLLAKKELFANKIFSYVVNALGAVSVDRGNSDLAAVKEILSLLQSGEVVTIYPEGTRVRNEDMSIGEFKSGVAMIALRSKVPVIPVYFAHHNRYRLFRPVHVYIGNPLDLSEYVGRKIHKEELETIKNFMYSSLDDLRNSAE